MNIKSTKTRVFFVNLRDDEADRPKNRVAGAGA